MNERENFLDKINAISNMKCESKLQKHRRNSSLPGMGDD